MKNFVRRFLVDVNNFRVRRVVQLVPFVENAFRPVEVLQSRQRFVVFLLLPERPADREVGVVAERVLLGLDALFGKPFPEDLVFREPGQVVAALFSVDQRQFVLLLKRLEKVGQPVLRIRVTVGADKQ